MKVALSLELTDGQRNELAQALDGKPVKRLASRDEVREFIDGCVAQLACEPETRVALTKAEPPPTPIGMLGRFGLSLSPAELKVAKQLRAQGKPDGFIRGWITVGRKLGKE